MFLSPYNWLSTLVDNVTNKKFIKKASYNCYIDKK